MSIRRHNRRIIQRLYGFPIIPGGPFSSQNAWLIFLSQSSPDRQCLSLSVYSKINLVTDSMIHYSASNMTKYSKCFFVYADFVINAKKSCSIMRSGKSLPKSSVHRKQYSRSYLVNYDNAFVRHILYLFLFYPV